MVVADTMRKLLLLLLSRFSRMFKMTRLFIGTMTVKTLVWSICFIYKIVIKITLK